VELRRVGLAPEGIPAATGLYVQGWSLAKLGTQFEVLPPLLSEHYEPLLS
jgi:hypothetical protein